MRSRCESRTRHLEPVHAHMRQHEELARLLARVRVLLLDEAREQDLGERGERGLDGGEQGELWFMRVFGRGTNKHIQTEEQERLLLL